MTTRRIACLLTMVIFMPTMVVVADEVTPFRITHTDGYFSLSYREDAQRISLAGDSETIEKRISMEESIFLNTEGYVYHPKFLSFDLGIGPQLMQNQLISTAGNSNQNETLYNVNADLKFLQDKPYPFTLSYYQEHPTLSLNLTDQFEQESTRYSANLQLKRPILPFNLVIDSSRQEMTGQGFERRIDDLVDQTIVRTYIPSAQDGYQQLVYSSTAIQSRSGLIGDPVTTTTINTDTFTYDSNLYFGKSKNIRFNNIVAFTDQTGVNTYQELRIAPSLRWGHSKSFESFYRLSYVDTNQVDIQSLNRNVATGVQKTWDNGLRLSADLGANQEQITGLSNTSSSANATLSYAGKFSKGNFSLSGGSRLDQVNRVITSNVPVRIELTLSGTNPYELPHDFIIHSSLSASLIVGQGAPTPLVVGIGSSCSAGIDLLVTPIGVKTRIIYCDGADGVDARLLLEYEYDPGGTVSYHNLTNFLQANIDILRKYSLFTQLRSSTPVIESGDPVLPLDESVTLIYGAKSLFPLGNDRDIGAEYTAEDQDSTLNPYQRSVFDIYYQNPLWRGSLRLSAQKIYTDYLNSDEDVDSLRTTLQYRARPNNNTTMTIEFSDTTDSGSSVLRQTRSGNIALDWRLRKLSMRTELRDVTELQGGNQQDRSLLRVSFKRDF